MVVEDLGADDGLHIHVTPVGGRVRSELGSAIGIEQKMGRGIGAICAQPRNDEYRAASGLVEDTGNDGEIFRDAVVGMPHIDIPPGQFRMLAVLDGEDKTLAALDEVIAETVSDAHGPDIVEAPDEHARSALQVRVTGLRGELQGVGFVLPRQESNDTGERHTVAVVDQLAHAQNSHEAAVGRGRISLSLA